MDLATQAFNSAVMSDPENAASWFGTALSKSDTAERSDLLEQSNDLSNGKQVQYAAFFVSV